MAVELMMEELHGTISHKKAWNEIAANMHTKGYNVSGKQCMTRINTMKRTYKTIKDHNAKSGNNTRRWKYYEIMENLLKEKPYMAPLATISSTGCVTLKERSISPSNSSCSSTYSSNIISRKRKATDNYAIEILEEKRKAEENKKKRHQEKMEMGTKLLHRLDKLIDKI
ncbi:uncharacterized protein [Mycetomoellerius zeteki]|nr:PREDICTED: uncharacterized protein LOC108721632 [Trachymyrmex zeteki]